MKEWTEPFVLIISLLPFVISFILTYIIEFKVMRKIDFLWNKKKKIQRAKELGQVVTAHLKGREFEKVSSDEDIMAKYVYELNGAKKSKVVKFGTAVCHGTHKHPKTIKIYYLGNRTYTDYDTSSAIDGLFAFLMFFGAGSVAMTLQAYIYPNALVMINPDAMDYVAVFKKGSLVVIVILILSLVLCVAQRQGIKKEIKT